MDKREIDARDVLAASFALVGVCVFYGVLVTTVPPFNRGFFCDDKTIQKPYTINQTVPNSLALAVGIALVFISVVILEIFNYYRSPRNVQCPMDDTFINILGCFKLKAWIVRIITRLIAFGFGALSNASITEVGKLMIGRLRPHFLAACKPNYSLFNCSQGFITVDVCTGTSKIVTEARKSFPSGHSSFSAFTMVFLALYIEHVWASRKNGFFKSLCQLVVILLALACGFSRISDYFHHWSDVLAGFALGTLYAFYIIYCFMNLPREERTVRMQRSTYHHTDAESGTSSAGSGNELDETVNHKRNEVFSEQ